MTSSSKPYVDLPGYFAACLVDDAHIKLSKEKKSSKDSPELATFKDPLKLSLPFKGQQSSETKRTKSKSTSTGVDEIEPVRIGILGGGIGGLYTALILDSLYTNGLNVQIEILEASHRTGGRLKTYKFNDGGEFDYYEEGAMRFPLPQVVGEQYLNGTMKRLVDLIRYRPLNEQEGNGLQDQLIEYHYDARSNDGDNPGFYYFNGVHQNADNVNWGGFEAARMGVEPDYRTAGAKAIHDNAINPFDMQDRTTDGWERMKANDAYSVRGYLASNYPLGQAPLAGVAHPLPKEVINWLNLLQSSSGGYDYALTEAVLAKFPLADVPGNNTFSRVDWKCFKGGSKTLPNRIVEYLREKNIHVQLNKRVTAIRKTDNINSADIRVEVQVSGEVGPRVYDHVFSTLPLPVLRTIDLNDAGLTVMQKNALRALHYGPSIKIAVRFTENWWSTKLHIFGGQSFTDLPIRTIVYPSYGIDDDHPSKVLIASYTWTTDASRLGALAALASRGNQEELKELVLRNLAEAHRGVHNNNDITYDFLKESFVELHVQDWNADKYSMGAFAHFAPGEFNDLYIHLNRPAAAGRLHFAGEALSIRHGWVVGALDSAWRAVYEYLELSGQNGARDWFKQVGNWGENWEWSGNRLKQHLELHVESLQ